MARVLGNIELTLKVLFVKLGAIGDIVHTLPSLAVARKAFPDAAIDWVVEARSAEILRGNPLINDLVEVNTRQIREKRSPDALLREIRTQAGNLRRRDYDIAIDFQGLLKSAGIAKLSGAKKRYGFDRQNLREPASRLLYTDTVEVPANINVIDKNLALLKAVLSVPPRPLSVPPLISGGLPQATANDEGTQPNTSGFADPPLTSGSDSSYEFPIHTESEHAAEAESIAALTNGRFALLNPAGGWVTKLWPAENYGRLADRIFDQLGISSIIATGPNEAELAERVAANSRHCVRSEPTLKGFYELAKRATVYVGGDTGPTHLAVAAGAPVVGIFGPTEWWRNGSPNPSDICVGREDINCRVDCHRRTCSKWICMDIDVETVFAAVKQRLDSAASQVKHDVRGGCPITN